VHQGSGPSAKELLRDHASAQEANAQSTQLAPLVERGPHQTFFCLDFGAPTLESLLVPESLPHVDREPKLVIRSLRLLKNDLVSAGPLLAAQRARELAGDATNAGPRESLDD
jgi:hypothetical protein